MFTPHRATQSSPVLTILLPKPEHHPADEPPPRVVTPPKSSSGMSHSLSYGLVVPYESSNVAAPPQNEASARFPQ